MVNGFERSCFLFTKMYTKIIANNGGNYTKYKDDNIYMKNEMTK